jgi:hypothetical protein
MPRKDGTGSDQRPWAQPRLVGSFTELGGTVTRVEHVADAGLLSSGRPVAGGVVPLGYAGADRSGAHDAGDTPSLDPVPQEIQAVVEARLTAEVAPLA